MRQQLSDTATAMFMERGFDAVRVAEVAEACGVSFVTVATQILAERAAMSTGDPEPQIAARAPLGLWHIQAESLRKHLDAGPARLHELVMSDVRRAARLIDTGLGSFVAGLDDATRWAGP